MIRNVLASAVLAVVVGVSGCGAGEAEAPGLEVGQVEQAVEPDAEEVDPYEGWCHDGASEEIDEGDLSVER